MVHKLILLYQPVLCMHQYFAIQLLQVQISAKWCIHITCKLTRTLVYHQSLYPYCFNTVSLAVLATGRHLDMACRKGQRWWKVMHEWVSRVECPTWHNIAYVISEAVTPWESCISLIQQWMTSNINNPLVSYINNGPKKGWSQLLTHSNGEAAKTQRELCKFVDQCQNTKGNDSTVR